MPTDRPARRIAPRLGLALAFALTLPATGCRNTRSEVPPERPYLSPGAAPVTTGGAPHVGFSTEPPAAGNAFGTAAATTPGLPGSSDGYGAPPSFQNPPAAYAGQPAAPPAPDPLQDMPGPNGAGIPPRGVMGRPGDPPSPY